MLKKDDINDVDYMLISFLSGLKIDVMGKQNLSCIQMDDSYNEAS